MDNFEKHLSRQTLRSVPDEWRDEILAQAAGCGAENAEPALLWWRQLIWPSPVAWSAVACAWVCIIGLNLASRPEPTEVPATADFFVRVMMERVKVLAEMSGKPSIPASKPPSDDGPDAFIVRKSPNGTA